VPTALITGISGQDGSYLAENLLERGYRVVGMVRGSAWATYPRIEHIRKEIELAEGDLLNQGSLEGLLRKYRPAEVYNFAASHPSSYQSFHQPVLTGEFNGLGVLRLLEAIRIVDSAIRFCQASTSELFGNARESPQCETTQFYPRNPYGVAKLYGHWITVNYRETHGMFACSSILFNHESPRRGDEFVTRKITRAVARIKAGLQNSLYLGDLEARRDWGYAADYVRAMWLMLQAPAADDYVLATGETHSVREFCRIAFGHVALNYERYVLQDTQKRRATETVQLVGDYGKARRVLGWHPTLTFQQLVCAMVDSDIEAVLGRAAR
jgi:GDPmannose 4,6-dehydratase